MIRSRILSILLAMALGTVVVAAAQAKTSKAKGVVTPASDVAWKEAGIPGVETAAVDGDMAKGASHFYLKYPAGFTTPVHHHTADHYVTTVKGTLVLTVNGKEHRLTPGSFFALTGKVPHAATCDGTEDCIMFIDARSRWDVVPEDKAASK